ncbi:putative Adenine nucleotide alpha hydrolases-like superfamily protein [Quillaja saponaria]|uniref:Adenine nucleotide alpha hydrolases-like superfamily protein n=1 Tax=Quillaja saponaria TaxID=32244 RepID=A0AAD7PFR3_QUISA|nr:putative Adenine nucleotide alpha hydrolases-like superfamily protein [Quillaja saponaria]
MGKRGTRLPGFCLNRIRPHARVRSPSAQYKLEASSIKITDQKNENSVNDSEQNGDKTVDEAKPGFVTGRRIMIVVDSSFEAKGAVQWALTHTVQSQDTLILLHVTKPSKQATGEDSNQQLKSPRAYHLLCSFKNLCQLKRPEVQIEVSIVEGQEKGPKIVEEARKQGVAFLVLGQKKRSTTWRLLMMWAGNRVSSVGVVEYCIQNADCMAIAVRRKSKKIGGYMITTKRHKDFWLLA